MVILLLACTRQPFGGLYHAKAIEAPDTVLM